MNFRQYNNIYYDSRNVKPGSIFVALKGEKTDGHDYLALAIEKGATLLVVQRDIVAANSQIQELINKAKDKFHIVEDSHQALAEISSEFYNNPSSKIKIIGVTGTNGKTTVTHLLQSIFETKSSCALLGTMGLKETVSSVYQDLKHTTPLAKETQEVLAGLVAKKYDYLVMEVSSHALDQKRVGAIKFKAAIVTNLTQDHLDYHLTMDSYFAAKAKIFLQTSGYAVINLDDDYASRFISGAKDKGLKVISYAVNQPADFRAENISFSDQGLAFDLSQNGQRTSFKLKLNGMFNVYNSLAAIACAVQEGFTLAQIRDILARAAVVPGRFEVIKEANSPFCIVDYAHTPDGLLNVLKGARALIQTNSSSKLICVFGCGGDRDMTKRPKMGKIAYELADHVVVTSDNPRSEEPDQIIADILTGIPNIDKVKVIPDRAQAIKEAIAFASSSDIVVIAGKGHEDYQILKNKTIHFDDREEVRRAIMPQVHADL